MSAFNMLEKRSASRKAISPEEVIDELRAHSAKMAQLQRDNDIAAARLVRYALMHVAENRPKDAERVLRSLLATLEG